MIRNYIQWLFRLSLADLQVITYHAVRDKSIEIGYTNDDRIQKLQLCITIMERFIDAAMTISDPDLQNHLINGILNDSIFNLAWNREGFSLIMPFLERIKLKTSEADGVLIQKESLLDAKSLLVLTLFPIFYIFSNF